MSKVINIKNFKKDISVYVPFETNRISFGDREIVYHGSKLGKSKDRQLHRIVNQLKRNRRQLDKAITYLTNDYVTEFETSD